MTTWAQAFREQALSDFQAGQALLGISIFHSQATMLLLMAWEKLAKSALYVHDPPAKASHRVAAKFVGILRTQVKLLAAPWNMSETSARSRLEQLQKDLLQLEALAPTQDVELENTEYPWKPDSEVRWPAQHLRSDYTLPTPSSRRLWQDFAALEAALPR